jgi:hypothetical protein
VPKVICKLPNASEEISGVRFAPHPDGAEHGMVSEDISQEQADFFVSIPGYELVGGSAQKAPADDTELDELRAKAETLGIKVKGNWKADRLKSEIKAAEDEKAAQEAAAKQSDSGQQDNAGQQ